MEEVLEEAVMGCWAEAERHGWGEACFVVMLDFGGWDS